jgi:hypothetical protein
VYDRKGKLIAKFYERNREDVSLKQVAPIMRKAIIAIEDSRFYQHGAIDVEGTSRALVNNLLGKRHAGWVQHHPAADQAAAHRAGRHQGRGRRRDGAELRTQDP